MTMPRPIGIEGNMISVRRPFRPPLRPVSNVKRVARAASKIQTSVLFCTVRLATTRRPSGESDGLMSPFSSGAPSVPRSLPVRSNHVNCLRPTPLDRYTTMPVPDAENARTNSEASRPPGAATVIGSPVSSPRVESKSRATKVPCRKKAASRVAYTQPAGISQRQTPGPRESPASRKVNTLRVWRRPCDEEKELSAVWKELRK